jgi:transposase
MIRRLTMPNHLYGNQKKKYLQDHGVLNKHPEKVRDELFLTDEFFDPQDLLQVRYEMIRCHQLDKVSVKEAAQRFGFSRPVFYEVEAKLEENGLVGLIPEKPGPKGPSKCTKEIIDFVQMRLLKEPSLNRGDIIIEIANEFGVKLHQRTIERGIARWKKKGQE